MPYELTKPAYYYYSRLNESEKALYREILAALLNWKSEIPINNPAITSDGIKRIYEYVLNDRPDIFWAAKRWTVRSINGVRTQILPEYLFFVRQAEDMMGKMVSSRFYREIDSILSSKSSSFEKALAAYEYIIQHCEYGSSGYDYNAQYEMYGVVLNNKAVCAGYTKAFQYFMNRHNVFCIAVTGITRRGNHAWNMVELSGEYYYIDTTWGDPVFSGGAPKNSDYVSYDYFCFTTADMMKSHGAVTDTPMPVCTATRYNYYKYFDLIDEYYDIEKVVRRIIDARRSGKSEVTLRYAASGAYVTAVARLITNKEIFDALEAASRYVKVNTNHLSYGKDDDKKSITITIV